MKKKFLSCLLTLCMMSTVIAVIPITVSVDTAGRYTYSVSNGKATITDCDTSASGVIAIPSTLGGYPVTSIGNDAFYNCSKIKDAYYIGTKEQWENISIGSSNSCLTNANIHYISIININYIINEENDIRKTTKAIRENEKVTLTTDTPTRTGRTFLGWATTKNAETAEYKSGDTIAVGNSDITLYAVWEQKSYTTTESADGLFIITPVGISNGSKIIIACYKNNTLTYTEIFDYDGSADIPFIISAEYDEVKVFVWDSVGNMTPVTEAEPVEL